MIDYNLSRIITVRRFSYSFVSLYNCKEIQHGKVKEFWEKWVDKRYSTYVIILLIIMYMAFCLLHYPISVQKLKMFQAIGL